MAFITTNRTQRIVTKGGLTEEEIKTVNKMVDERKPMKEIEDYLLNQDHIIIGEETFDNTILSLINVAHSELDVHRILKVLDTMFSIP